MGEWVELFFEIAAAVFFAGQLFRTVVQLRRDLNGIGAKTNSDRTVAQRRYHNLCLAMLVTEETRDGREKLAALLKDEP